MITSITSQSVDLFYEDSIKLRLTLWEGGIPVIVSLTVTPAGKNAPNEVKIILDSQLIGNSDGQEYILTPKEIRKSPML